MACKREARKRHNTIAFWLSDEEKGQVEARIRLSGLPKGEYYRKCILGAEVQVIAGNYMSNRLARVLENMQTKLLDRDEEEDAYLRELLEQILKAQKSEKPLS